MAEYCKGSDRSPSSSMDSSTHPALSTTSAAAACRPAGRDLSTDLRLGLSLSSLSSSYSLQAAESIPSTPRNQLRSDWPPIKLFLRSTLTASARARRRRTQFVKVYMEGVPIGRKLDLLLLDGYDSLLVKLCHMFKTPITYADEYHQQVPGKKGSHFLTYEDQDGDWMMVGDVPWELFLNCVKKLRITRTDRY